LGEYYAEHLSQKENERKDKLQTVSYTKAFDKILMMLVLSGSGSI